MLESEKIRLQLIEQEQLVKKLEENLQDSRNKVTRLRVELESAINVEIARDNNLITVSVFNIGPGVNSNERIVLLRDLKEDLQRRLLENGEVIDGGGGPSSWSATKWVISKS